MARKFRVDTPVRQQCRWGGGADIAAPPRPPILERGLRKSLHPTARRTNRARRYIVATPAANTQRTGKFGRHRKTVGLCRQGEFLAADIPAHVDLAEWTGDR